MHMPLVSFMPYACQKLPRFVKDLTRDVHNYFSFSPKRVAEFTQFQNFCNVKIHKILHPSQTRWLSLHPDVARILEQYGPLQLFFTGSRNYFEKIKRSDYKSIFTIFRFHFTFFTNLNKEMQSESPKLHLLYRNISNNLKSIFHYYINRKYLLKTPLEDVDYENPRNYLPIEHVYFGATGTKSLSENKLSAEQLHFLRVRCLDFYIEASAQIIQDFKIQVKT